MLERFNRRIGDVLKTHRFHSGEDPEQTLLCYVEEWRKGIPGSVRSPANRKKQATSPSRDM